MTATDRTLSIAEGMGTERVSSKDVIAPALPGLVSCRNTVERTRKIEPTKMMKSFARLRWERERNQSQSLRPLMAAVEELREGFHLILMRLIPPSAAIALFPILLATVREATLCAGLTL